MTNFSDEDLSSIENTINQMPRKILKYACPDDLFEAFLDQKCMRCKRKGLIFGDYVPPHRGGRP